jgi:hypothetical protein
VGTIWRCRPDQRASLSLAVLGFELRTLLREPHLQLLLASLITLQVWCLIFAQGQPWSSILAAS